MSGEGGHLLHCWRGGEAKLNAYLDDYATLTNALVTLYEASFDDRRIDQAVQLAEIMLSEFRDAEEGGFFYTSHNHERLISRAKDTFDDATPSSNAMAATALIRLGKLTGNNSYLEAAAEVIQLGAVFLTRSAIATSQLLVALDLYVGPTYEIAILAGNDQAATSRVLSGLRRSYIPNRVVACRESSHPGGSSHLSKMFEGKTSDGHQPIVFVCENFTCREPAEGEAGAQEAWKTLASPQRK